MTAEDAPQAGGDDIAMKLATVFTDEGERGVFIDMTQLFQRIGQPVGPVVELASHLFAAAANADALQATLEAGELHDSHIRDVTGALPALIEATEFILDCLKKAKGKVQQ